MRGILTYALHYEGEFNKNSLGAVSEGAKLAKEIGGDAAVVVVGGDDLTDELCGSVGKDGAAPVEDVDVQLSEWSTKAKMLQRGEQRGADVNIEDADILVAGGRGLGKKEGFELAENLADALGGAVAATRAVVDAGWYPYA